MPEYGKNNVMNDNIRKADCSLEWHNDGGYKLSAYMGLYNEDPNMLSPSGNTVWVGGSKGNIYLYKARNTGRWIITGNRESIKQELGVLRTSIGYDGNEPPINASWECWNKDHGIWWTEVYSEKGWVSMDGFKLY